MGATVGLTVGTTVGAIVGFTVGAIVGFTVGLADGDKVFVTTLITFRMNREVISTMCAYNKISLIPICH